MSITGALVGSRNLLSDRLITDAGRTSRSPKQVARIGVSAVRVHFVGWYSPSPVGSGDVDCPNSYTVRAYLEHGGVATPVLFAGGAASVSVPPGGDVVGTVTRSIAAGDTYFVRCFVEPDVPGGSYPGLNGVLDYPSELHAAGVDVANGVGDLPDYGQLFGPCMVTGTQVAGPRKAVVVIGNSIEKGEGDDFAATDHVGYWYRALDASDHPFMILAVSGEQAAEYVAQGVRRAEYIGPGVQYLVEAYGINDLQGGRSLAQLQAAKIAIWSAAVGRNPELRVLPITLTPKSSSTDGWTTTTNQTPDFTVDPPRVQYNAWVRAGCPMSGGVAVAVGTPGALLAGQPGHPAWGYIEVADHAEPYRDAGIWRVDGGPHTGDGVHPNVLGHTDLAAGVDLTDLVDVPMTALDLATTPAAARAAAGRDSAAVGVALPDSSAAVRAAGGSDAPAIGVALTDTPANGRVYGVSDELTFDLLADTPRDITIRGRLRQSLWAGRLEEASQ